MSLLLLLLSIFVASLLAYVRGCSRLCRVLHKRARERRSRSLELSFKSVQLPKNNSTLKIDRIKEPTPSSLLLSSAVAIGSLSGLLCICVDSFFCCCSTGGLRNQLTARQKCLTTVRKWKRSCVSLSQCMCRCVCVYVCRQHTHIEHLSNVNGNIWQMPAQSQYTTYGITLVRGGGGGR